MLASMAWHPRIQCREASLPIVTDLVGSQRYTGQSTAAISSNPHQPTTAWDQAGPAPVQRHANVLTEPFMHSTTAGSGGGGGGGWLAFCRTACI